MNNLRKKDYTPASTAGQHRPAPLAPPSDLATASATNANLKRLTDRFGEVLAGLRRLSLTHHSTEHSAEFTTLERKIAHILLLQEQAATATATSESEAAN